MMKSHVQRDLQFEDRELNMKSRPPRVLVDDTHLAIAMTDLSDGIVDFPPKRRPPLLTTVSVARLKELHETRKTYAFC